MQSKRATLAEVAERCGVSTMTASRALRVGTRVSPETRAAVQAAARELGYRSDPFMSVLVNYRRNVRAPRRTATVAYVTNYPAGTPWRDWPIYGGYFQGARERAEQLGYGTEEFPLGAAGSLRRAEEILHHRGYVGLLLGPTLSAAGHTRLELGELPAVALGRSLRLPRLHYAASDPYRSTLDLLHRLKRLGYRRPGFAAVSSHDARTEHRASAAFLSWQSLHVPEAARVPCCLLTHEEFSRGAPRWFRKWKPDVVVGSEVWAAMVLEKGGVRFPADAAFASPGLQAGDEERFSGMRLDAAATGAAALDLLHSLILRGEGGVPAMARGVSVDALWHAGATAPGPRAR